MEVTDFRIIKIVPDIDELYWYHVLFKHNGISYHKWLHMSGEFHEEVDDDEKEGLLRKFCQFSIERTFDDNI